MSTVDKCPTCGATSVRACVDSSGRDMTTDHADRPRELVKLLDLFPPQPDRDALVRYVKEDDK